MPPTWPRRPSRFLLSRSATSATRPWFALELAAAVAHYHAQTAEPATANASHAVRGPDSTVGSRTERAAQRLAQRRAIRRARFERPVQRATLALLHTVGIFSTVPRGGARAERLAKRRGHLHRRLRSGAIALLALIGVVGGTSGAYAYFTTTGAGTATSTAGTLTVTVKSSTASATLIPGGSSGLLVELTKPNGALTITGIAPGPGSVTATGGNPTCTTSAIAVNTNSSLNVPVPTGTDETVTIPNGVSMGTGSTSDCQTATFQVPVTLTVQQG